MTYLEQALQDGLATLEGAKGNRRIRYVAVGHSERYDDPEERVRAEFWAELVYRYEYPVGRIGVEVTVPDRTPSDRADLVVFKDDGRKDPYAVVECKRDGISDAEFTQAIEQASGNGTWAKLRAVFVGVVAGQTRRFLDFSPRYGVLEREANIIADLPKSYGAPLEFKYFDGRPGYADVQPVSRGALQSTLAKCHQSLWGGGRLSPPAAFGELSKLLFVKIQDEKNLDRAPGDPYQFQIRTHETADKLAARVRALYKKQQDLEPDVFVGRIDVDDHTVLNIVSHLEGISLSETDLDVKGVAFERFVDSFFKGDFGQYFTPRPIIELCVAMVDPQRGDVVLDPSCGSGGFLLYALNHVRQEAQRRFGDTTAGKGWDYWHSFAEHNLFGIEINDEIARVTKMNMILHDDGHANIGRADALLPFDRLRATAGNDGFREGAFDVVLSNPPFGAKVNLAQSPYLDGYDLAKLTNKGGFGTTRKVQKTEVLFLERIRDFLKPGTGRAAVVLPDGILTNSSLAYVRAYLLEHFAVQAVVSLPATAFAHFGAGVKSSVVVLRRLGAAEARDPDRPVFMAQPELVGYDATGRQTENQLDEVLERYRAFERDPAPFFA